MFFSILTDPHYSWLMRGWFAWKTTALLSLSLSLAASCSGAFAYPILDRVTKKGELTGVLKTINTTAVRNVFELPAR
ncbi:hypothetical protein CES87_28135 [Pseudomonas sp. ERMR1:02]|nr:hypothetical protein CES87_28135 [Pseudomonas sp. ERMR1:02]